MMYIFRNQKGQAIVELVMVVTIFCVLLYGIVDLVQIGIVKHVIDSACREGARAASSIPDLRNDNEIVLSRVRKILIDGKVMNHSRIDKPLPAPQIKFIRGGGNNVNAGNSSGAGVFAQKDDIVIVSMSVQYNTIFSVLTGDALKISGEAASKYLV